MKRCREILSLVVFLSLVSFTVAQMRNETASALLWLVRCQADLVVRFAQLIESRKVANHQFATKTDKPSVEALWQIPKLRRDAYTKPLPLVGAQAKSAGERGHYVHPGLLGQSRVRS
jgi:hypothetical protein